MDDIYYNTGLAMYSVMFEGVRQAIRKDKWPLTPAKIKAGLESLRGFDANGFIAPVTVTAKDHGGGGRVAGALDPGDRVAITEDAVTRGVSMLEAAEVVRECGAEPVLLVPVVDRGGTVAALAAEAGIPLHALVTAPDLGFPYERDVPG
jgi:branched-chain amino acid transport system substrate-binding protein